MKTLKTLLLATAVAISTIASAQAADRKDLSDAEVLDCHGQLTNIRSVQLIQCMPPEGEEAYDLNLNTLDAKDSQWLTAACGHLGFCRVQVLARDGQQMMDSKDAIAILHITNKPKFSWET